MARVLDVAGFFVYLRDLDMREDSEYVSLSVLKLQKLLYYAQGGHVRWDNERLLTDVCDGFEAWEYGPKITSIDEEFGAAGQNDIAGLSVWPPYKKYASYEYFDRVLSESERETIVVVWEQLKRMDTFDLVEQTRSESPWRSARERGELRITDDSIREYFRSDLRTGVFD